MVGVLATAGAARAQDFLLPDFIGTRGGFSTSGQAAANFIQVEGFADWNLPWKGESESGWFLQTKLNIAAGWLDSSGNAAFVGSLGPAVAFGKRRFPASLEGGISPTLLSHYRFDTVNLGQSFQSTSYLGVNVDLTEHWRVGYRYQHVSNGGLNGRSNPGLNLNMFALSYAF